MGEPESNDPQYWKWSVFYYNPNDKNRFVQRPDGLGLSPNYAHKGIYLILALVLLVILVFLLYFWLV